MRDGKIIERATRAELIKQKGYYAKLYHTQFEDGEGMQSIIMIRPDLEEARNLAKKGGALIPLAMECLADLKTPVGVLRTLAAGGREVYLLESAPGGDNWGRYTFIGYEPVMQVSGTGNSVTIRDAGGIRTREGEPHKILKEIAGAYKSPRIHDMPPFTGGFVGYFAYEYIRHTEPTIRLTELDKVGFHDFRLMLFDRVIAFDNLRQKILLIVNIRTDNLEQNYIDGVTLLKDMEKAVLSQTPERPEAGGLDAAYPMSAGIESMILPEAGGDGGNTAAERLAGFSSSFSKDAFCAAAEKVKHHIFEGDIFQCVPSVRFKAGYRGDLLPAYRVLRTTNPSAYMFYMRFDDLQLAGASPETLVSLRDGIVYTCPIAGTCKKTEDEAETNRLIEALIRDEKELAEHDMLVDLGRNDLGKVCRFGSVKVEEYRSVKKLSHVCHIASKVTGEIAEGCDALDVMAALLPAGTLSGAPKKRACEIIDEIEGEKRGVYGGAVGYIDFAGNMDLCIGIRMAVLKDNTVYVQAGAGIVADSVPEKEYEECLNKAGAMMDALRKIGKEMGK
ncbi:anthranilate synthase component I [Synergistales bacterium]|nr:anthranilate synthase component I [Synergistales bacterium]